MLADYPSCCLGKVKVDSIDDVEEMQIMDEAFDILGFKWYVQRGGPQSRIITESTGMRRLMSTVSLPAAWFSPSLSSR